MTSTLMWATLALLLLRLVAGSPVTVVPRAITALCMVGEKSDCITNTRQASYETSVVNGKTIQETFFPTTFSQFATISARTTITTTDASGATILAIVGAGGAGYLVYAGAAGAAGGGLVQLGPPPLPTISGINVDPTTTPAKTTISSSAISSSDKPFKTQNGIFYTDVADAGPMPITVPSDVKACSGGGGDQIGFQLSFAESTVSNLCKLNANTEVGKSPLEGVFSLDAGKELNISISQLPIGCDPTLNQTQVDEASCNYYLGEALNGCDTDSNTIKYGGSVKNGCLQYFVGAQTASGELRCTPNDLPSLPSLPGSPANQVTYGPRTGMDREEALANINGFCNQIIDNTVNGRDIHPKETSDLQIYYNPSRGNTQMNISLTYSEQVQCPQSGKDAVYRTDRESCKRLLGRIIDGCNTDFKRPYGKFGGILNDACGVFAVQTANVEPIACTANGAAAPQAVSEAAINQFCSRGFHLDPNKQLSSGQFYQDAPDGFAWDSYLSGKYLVRTELKFASLPQDTGCQKQKAAFAVNGDECRRRLGTIASKCAVGGTMGAQQAEGCVTWSMNMTSV